MKHVAADLTVLVQINEIQSRDYSEGRLCSALVGSCLAGRTRKWDPKPRYRVLTCFDSGGILAHNVTLQFKVVYCTVP